MVVARKEIKAKLVKEENQGFPDKVELPGRGGLKEKRDQEDLRGPVDYREIQAIEVPQVHRDPRVLRVHREYREFKA